MPACPRRCRPLPGDPLGRKRAYVALSRRNAGALIAAHRAASHEDPLRVARAPAAGAPRRPGTGRAAGAGVDLRRPLAGQGSGWFSVLFSENWAIVGRFRRLLAILLNGRDTMVRFAAPVSLRDSHRRGAAARTHRAQALARAAHALPPHPRRGDRPRPVHPPPAGRPGAGRRAGARGDRRPGASATASKPEDAWKKAHAYAWEIAADYSNPVVRSAQLPADPRLEPHLRRRAGPPPGQVQGRSRPAMKWSTCPATAATWTTCCCRYLLYERGIVPPHIAAGVNLNLPVIGILLRKGGAFFMRRSFRGNALYSAVFTEYVAQLVSGGYSLEYFIEGGRSRTGRLLQPKGGMIAMTVRAFLRQPTRPVLFQPVYIGYEKLMEGNSYLDELTGKPKEKESIWALLWGIPKVLRQNYGQVVVNFGEADPPQRGAGASMRPDWNGAADGRGRKAGLARRHRRRAGRSRSRSTSTAPPTSIRSTCWRSRCCPRPSTRWAKPTCSRRSHCRKTLLRRNAVLGPRHRHPAHAGRRSSPTARRSTCCTASSTRSATCWTWSSDDTAVLLSYFRNNVLHLFTAAAWIACCFQTQPAHGARNGVMRLGRTLYPFLQAELFLPWSEDEFAERLERDHRRVRARGPAAAGQRRRRRHPVAQRRARPTRCSACARSAIRCSRPSSATTSPSRVLVKNGPGMLGAASWRSLCQLAAQRLSLLYAPAAPEFFDKTLFRGFIQKLRELKLVWPDAERQAGVRRAPGRLGQGRQGHPGPRVAPHHHQDFSGSGEEGHRLIAREAFRRRFLAFVAARLRRGAGAGVIGSPEPELDCR